MPEFTSQPLAERLRPQKLTDIIGQDRVRYQLLAAVEKQRLPSVIFWGPPGVGKTTFARLLASALERPFFAISAIQSGVKEVRAVLEQARFSNGAVLFIDEIHRFNKAQQDSLLAAVEEGLITLIGATTENPSFEVIPALLSRCQVFVLKALEANEVMALLERAINQDALLQLRQVQLKESSAIVHLAAGDGRKALNLLESLVYQTTETPLIITDALVATLTDKKVLAYDSETHYDIISAFIKSIRGSDPNAGLYWLARMLESGEDIRFIARRLIILASEDIGNANPNALLLATACFQAVDVIGMPEARIILAQTVTYLATSPKSNASYRGIEAALACVRKKNVAPVPLHLRNAPTSLMKNLEYGKGYAYSHDFNPLEGNQEYLPEGLEATTFYYPKEIGKEKEIASFLQRKWGGKYDYQ